MKTSALLQLAAALGISAVSAHDSAKAKATYDYIIAGGGPSGLVVAGKLAESGASVLLVERGGPSTASTGGKAIMPWNSSVTQYDVPAMAFHLAGSNLDPELPWCMDIPAAGGCLLGGGGMVNALMFVPPQDADFDDKWPEGWKASDVRAASERFFARTPGTLSPSEDGKRYDQGAYNALSKFLISNGFHSGDPFKQPGDKVDVFSYPPSLIQDGLRSGPIRTYLPKALAMNNFKLKLHTNITRAVRDGDSGFFSGVELQNPDGSREVVNVTPGTGKVIFAAGALTTPRLLMYSGIGPEEELQKVPFAVQSPHINLPVGKGVMDHAVLTVKFQTKSPLVALNSSAITSPDEETIELYSQGSGLLAQSGQRLVWWSSVSPSDGQTRFFQGTCSSSANNEVNVKLYITHGLTSSANITLDATGIRTEVDGQPHIQTKGDIEAFHLMLDRLIAMASKPDSTLAIKMSNGSTAPAGLTADALFKDILPTMSSASHWVGTARMGLDDGRAGGRAVVDTNAKVYGTENLFVVDASMHPDVPTGNTQAIIMVAAEHAASKILALGGGNTTSIGGKKKKGCRK